MSETIVQGTVEAWLPSKPPRPAPALMNTETTLLFFNLRSDTDPPTKGKNTLHYYVAVHGLKNVLIGKQSMFTLRECLRFLREKESR